MRKLLVALLLLIPTLSFGWSTNIEGQITTCIETAVTTSGHNRSAQLDANSYYVLYGTDNATIGTYVAIECIQGGSAVTVVGGVGIEIDEQEKIIIFTGNYGRYVSCLSAAATKHYHLCKIQNK
jgi:hypothetical protein